MTTVSLDPTTHEEAIAYLQSNEYRLTYEADIPPEADAPIIPIMDIIVDGPEHDIAPDILARIDFTRLAPQLTDDGYFTNEDDQPIPLQTVADHAIEGNHKAQRALILCAWNQKVDIHAKQDTPAPASQHTTCACCDDPASDKTIAPFYSPKCEDIYLHEQRKAKPRLKPVHAIVLYGHNTYDGPYTIVKFQGTKHRCQEELPGRAGEIILTDANQEVVIHDSGEVVQLKDLPFRETITGHLGR